MAVQPGPLLLRRSTSICNLGLSDKRAELANITLISARLLVLGEIRGLGETLNVLVNSFLLANELIGE